MFNKLCMHSDNEESTSHNLITVLEAVLKQDC